jgi:cytoskeletal protein RodZ
VTGYGPPDDPSEAPTGYYDYGSNGDQPPPQGSGPWYRNPIILVALGLFVAILLGLAFYLLADQTNGHGGTTQTPTSPTTSTTTPTTTSEITTTTEPVAPPETTTMTEPPSTTEPTTTTPATTTPTTTSADECRHHHHHHDCGTP